jgi:4-diphosphocytidyl-2-C-methyl-D-erythritol kinase
VGLKTLWGEPVSLKALEKIGAGLGADVPFCLRGGTAVARGAGEDLAVLACARPVWWVLGFASEGLSTTAVYEEFDARSQTGLGDPWEVADALARGDLDRLAAGLRNDLEPAALSLRPDLAAGRDAMGEAGALAALLSGSGPTWLGLARDEAHARAVAESAADVFVRVEVAHSVTHGARPARP